MFEAEEISEVRPSIFPKFLHMPQSKNKNLFAHFQKILNLVHNFFLIPNFLVLFTNKNCNLMEMAIQHLDFLSILNYKIHQSFKKSSKYIFSFLSYKKITLINKKK